MNKLAVLAFSILSFCSVMLWYLASGSLNEYLKSQVTLQGQYYTEQHARLVAASFSSETGISQFKGFYLSNHSAFAQPWLLTIESIESQLAPVPLKELNGPSIAKKTTTIVQIEKVSLNNVVVWLEYNHDNPTNIELILNRVQHKLATDYPALYPELSAKLYAQKHPERDAGDVESSIHRPEQGIEDGMLKQTFQPTKAVIESKKIKEQKRLLGKAITRVEINSIIINELKLIQIQDNEKTVKVFNDVSLGEIGDENGLASNQVGGEVLKRLFIKVSNLEK